MSALLKHNQEAYKNVQKMLKEKGRAAVVHPTGTGKTYLAAQLVKDNPNKRVLFMAPTYEILRHFAQVLEDMGVNSDEVELAIYNQGKKQKLLKDAFDLIVLDEFHHCGAEVWGKTVEAILENNPNAQILGLSATPVRVLDNFKDMSDVLFNGAVASTITLEQAIEEKLLPLPTYITANYTYQKDLENLDKKIASVTAADRKKALEEKRKKLDLAVKKALKPEQILKKHLKGNEKLVVFCENENELISSLDAVSEWVLKATGKEPQLFAVTASQKDQQNTQAISEFESADGRGVKLLFAINKLNEGVHIAGVDGAIMLRHTTSPILYRQQLGRAMSTNVEKSPIIFDFVDNCQVGYLGSSFFDQIKGDLEAGEANEIDKNFFDYSADIRELIKEIDLSTQQRWEDWFALAQQYSKEHGNLFVPLRHKVGEYSLGNWISNQRWLKKKNLLSEEREQKLNSIGMVYDVKVAEFYDALNKIDAYLEKTGKSINDLERGDMLNLGLSRSWLSTKKKNFKREKLDKYKIEELKKRGFEFCDHREVMFNKNLKYIEEYSKEKSCTINEIESDVVYKGLPIGSWISDRRSMYKQGRLPDYQIEELEKRGIIWDTQRHQFYEKLKKLDKILQKYGWDINDLRGDFEEDGFKGGWIAQKRANYKKGELADYQIEELEKRGIIWEVKKHDFYTGLGRLDEILQKNNWKIKDVPGTYVDPDSGFNAAGWINTKKLTHRRGAMPNYQKEELESRGINWGRLTNR